MAHIVDISFEIVPTKKSHFHCTEITKFSSGRTTKHDMSTHLSLKAAQLACVESMDTFCKFMGYKRTKKNISIDITKCGVFNFGD
jgi:hypothetical protein